MSEVEPYEIHCRVCGCRTGIVATDVGTVQLTDKEDADLQDHQRACILNSRLGRAAFADMMSRVGQSHHRRRILRGDPIQDGWFSEGP